MGDPFSEHSRSGVNYNVFSRFKKSAHCILVDGFDLDLRGINKCWAALKNISLDRRRWGNKLHQNPWAFNRRTRMAESILKGVSTEFNLIYQDGAMFLPGWMRETPFVSFHDCNVILSHKGGPYAHGSHYSGRVLDKTISQEKMVYEQARLIFTASNWLKNSLVTDFGISPEKVITVFRGTNIQPINFNKDYNGRTILFVGKNFKRKGGHILLKAFKLVRRELSDARLIIIGPNIPIDEPGVEVKGLVTDKEMLKKYYQQASVFVMPSLFEPFGIVFLEAYAFKTSCIGTNICAIPEIIDEGKSGFLIPPNDYKILADRMLILLKDTHLSKKMGSYAFEKVKKVFNWDTVVDKMLFHCAKTVEY